MPPVQAALKTKLESIFTAVKDSPVSDADFADQTAAAVTGHIKTAPVTVNAGIPVTAPAGPGAASAPGTGSLP